MKPERENCPMRHECGNCLPAGCFCTAVNDHICEALNNAFNHGVYYAITIIKRQGNVLGGRT